MKYRALLGLGLGLGLGLAVAGCSSHETRSPDSRNVAASLPETRQFDTRGWKVVTSFTNRRENTMHTLYGNDPAVSAARAGQASYPPGAVLSLVTWKGQEDDNWFGATIPGRVQSVEQITFSAAGAAQPSYDRYEGSSLEKTTVDPAAAGERIAFIVRQRASVMP